MVLEFYPSYNQSFIPLPLEGSRINKELATTFQPDVGSTSSAQRSSSVSAGAYKTRYHEDFASNVIPGKDYRLSPFRPKIQKHVRDDDRLLYGESITHESFRDVSSYHMRSSGSLPRTPSIERPVYKLSGVTRYNEEFTPCHPLEPIPDVPITKNSTSSGTANRVVGPSVPRQIREFVLENGPEHLQDANIREVLLRSPTIQPNSLDHYSNRNPYMNEYLNS